MANLFGRLAGLFNRQSKEAEAPVIIPKPEIENPFKVFEVTGDYATCTDNEGDLPFEQLNPLQSCFYQNYDPAKNAVVEAGTGTGKTVLAYIASRKFLDIGKRIVMTAPTRELVRQLHTDATNIWGAKIVGLYAGSDKSVEGKFFVVTTPEGFISALRSKKEWAEKASLLIVDEAHNIADSSRGHDLDAAVTFHHSTGGKLLLMSGTFPNATEAARIFSADIYLAKYSRTKIERKEVVIADDIAAAVAAQATMTPNTITTLSGYAYNRMSERVKKLKEILEAHREQNVLVFVPTKTQGFCLSESLAAGFHCADIPQEDRKTLVEDFNSGKTKLLIATNTLSQGINTPCDVVVIFGGRRGGYYMDCTDVGQCIGRAGRGKDTALAYIIGDRIELHNARHLQLSKGLALPTESLALTLLSQGPTEVKKLAEVISMSYAFGTGEAVNITEVAEKYLRFLGKCGLTIEREGKLSLNMEGTLLARYYIPPSKYMAYVIAARKLASSVEMPVNDKGFTLLTYALPKNGSGECPSKIEKEFQMRLIPMELEPAIKQAANYKYYVSKPAVIPPYLVWQIKDADRWLGCLRDMEKFNVHKEAPGKACMEAATMELKKAAAKADAIAKAKKQKQAEVKKLN